MGTVPMPLRLAGLPRSMGWLPFATLALCVLGVADAAYQCYADVTNTGLAGCAAKVDACVTVQHSPEAYIFGIPVAVFGVVFYAFMVVICSPPAWRSPLPAVRRLRLAAVVTGMLALVVFQASAPGSVREPQH
jgi:uncharacterized membrane protein